jgi:hypothetical protein
MPCLGTLVYRGTLFGLCPMYSLQSGDRLDHYHIESLAAQSGMASIFRATDLRNGRIIAIKVPHLEVESDPLGKVIHSSTIASSGKRRLVKSSITLV